MENISKKCYDKKRFILPLLFFAYPVGLVFLFKGKPFSKLSDKGLAAGAFGFYFLFLTLAVVLVGGESGNFKANKETLALIDTQIKQGNLEEARIQINKHLAKYSNKELEVKKNEIDKALSLEELELTLSTMNEDRFEKLKNGTLTDLFFTDTDINNHFIARLKENVGRRTELAATYQAAQQQRQAADLEANRQAKIESLFSKYNGSHRGLVKYVENAMHDPDSFEHVETKIYDKQDYILVRMIYRGNNKLGEKVKESVLAKCDFEGNVISIEQ